MIYSMTGFAVVSCELPYGALNLELRSVNHRYLDVQFRLPDELRMLETPLRERISRRLTRGKVECRLGFARLQSDPRGMQLNSELLAQLASLEGAVRAALPEARPLAVADVLRWPGILDVEEVPVEELQQETLALFDRALDELAAARAREGDKLKDMLLERVARMEQLVADVAPRIPKLLAAFQEKLGLRLREALTTGDDERVRQELALFAAKIDVAEELSRLCTHLAEVRRILDAGGVVGKRLDFMMQELNREANTLGSKSVDAEISQISMELKVFIEQMREQIQNIE